jgi:hypothetical protein
MRADVDATLSTRWSARQKDQDRQSYRSHFITPRTMCPHRLPGKRVAEKMLLKVYKPPRLNYMSQIFVIYRNTPCGVIGWVFYKGWAYGISLVSRGADTA